jgi:hypothetical protein
MLAARPTLVSEVFGHPKVKAYTALILACEHGHLAMAKALVKAGALVDQASSRGETPLNIAAATNNLGLTQWLVQGGGADLNPVDRRGGTPMFTAALEEHLDIVQWLSSMSAAALPADSPIWEVPEVKAALERGAKDRASAERPPSGMTVLSCCFLSPLLVVSPFPGRSFRPFLYSFSCMCRVEGSRQEAYRHRDFQSDQLPDPAEEQ